MSNLPRPVQAASRPLQFAEGVYAAGVPLVEYDSGPVYAGVGWFHVPFTGAPPFGTNALGAKVGVPFGVYPVGLNPPFQVGAV